MVFALEKNAIICKGGYISRHSHDFLENRRITETEDHAS